MKKKENHCKITYSTILYPFGSCQTVKQKTVPLTQRNKMDESVVRHVRREGRQRAWDKMKRNGDVSLDISLKKSKQV